MAKSTVKGVDAEQAVNNIFENSMVLELVTKRYGIKVTCSTDLIEFNGGTVKENKNGKTIKAANVSKEYFSIRKKLFLSTEWQAVKNFDQETYRWVQFRAVKSNLRPGMYRLPNALFADTEAYLNARKTARVPLVEAFVEALPTLQVQAAKDMGIAYNPADYDTPAKVRSAFFFDYNVLAESVPHKLKEISRDAYHREEAKAKAKVSREVEAMVNELRQGFAKLVGHAVEKLTPDADGKPKQFKASTLENINKFLGLFDARNLAGDMELARMVKEARTVMAGVSAKAIRTDVEAHKSVAASFERLNAELATMVHESPNRKFKTLED